MKLTTIATSLGLLMASCAPALAENIAAGRDGGGYDSRADSFVEQVRGDWATENFSGSEDIARAVCADNDTPIGIMQIDAMVQMQNEGCSLQPVGIYPAQEYAFIMFPPDGYNELDDLGPENNVLIGEVGSGAALFWRTIVQIEQDHGRGNAWSQMGTVFGPFALADTKASFGEIDAAILVTSPDAQIIQDLLSAGWNIGELDDKDIDDFIFGRGPLYVRSTIEVDHPNQWRNVKQDAIEVRSFWAANSDWVANNASELARFASIIRGIQ